MYNQVMATQSQPPEANEESEKERQNPEVCNVVRAVEEMGSEWKLIILDDLREGEKRFNELKHSTGASSYTLSRVLEDLQEDGLVENRKEFEAPVASYYTLTEKGDALCPVFDALDEWGGAWV